MMGRKESNQTNKNQVMCTNAEGILMTLTLNVTFTVAGSIFPSMEAFLLVISFGSFGKCFKHTNRKKLPFKQSSRLQQMTKDPYFSILSLFWWPFSVTKAMVGFE